MNLSEMRPPNPSERIELNEEGNEQLVSPTRLAKYMAVIAMGSALTTFLIVNNESLATNVAAATSFTDLNNETSQRASDILDMPVRVDCNTPLLDDTSTNKYGEGIHIMGQVTPLLSPNVALPVMTLRESVCENLLSVETGTPSSDIDAYLDLPFADAVNVVLHEGEHIRNEFNEAAASCSAGQKLPGALEELGVSRLKAEEMALSTIYDEGLTLLPEYYSSECAPGGELDLGISTVYLQPVETIELPSIAYVAPPPPNPSH